MLPKRSPLSSRAASVSEQLLDSPEKPPGRPELLGKNADTGPVAQDIVVPKHVDHVEPGLQRADDRQGESMGQADVALLVRRVRRIVRVADASPEATAGDHVDARAGTAPEKAHAATSRDELAVVGDDVVVLDVRV